MSKDHYQSYDDFYQSGGWTYDVRTEMTKLENLIVRPAQWPRGGRILEIGCGCGVHAYCLHQLGFKVVAVDLSDEGIRIARETFAGPEFIACDLAEYTPDGPFDGILSHGMSWFHYELDGVNCHGEWE